MLRLFRRFARSRSAAVPAPVADAASAPTAEAATCSLAACVAGEGATVLEVHCSAQEACRLRALGLCEGARVDVVDARHAVLLEVRGTRIAIGRALSAGITVQPDRARRTLPLAPVAAGAVAAGAVATVVAGAAATAASTPVAG